MNRKGDGKMEEEKYFRKKKKKNLGFLYDVYNM